MQNDTAEIGLPEEINEEQYAVLLRRHEVELENASGEHLNLPVISRNITIRQKLIRDYFEPIAHR